MKNRGFTMVELMIVIAVIAVLASIIMPKMGGSRDKAKLEACKTSLRHITIAMALYANDNRGHYYPPNDGVTYDWINSSCYLFNGGYLKNVPVCPAAAGTVTYNYVINEAPTVPEAYFYCNSYWAGSQSSHPGLQQHRPRYYPDRGFYEN